MNNYRSIEQANKELAQLTAKWAKISPKVDEEQTFAGIQNKIQANSLFLMNERSEMNKEVGKLKKDWSASRVEEARKDAEADYKRLCETVISATKKEVKALIAAKVKKLETMVQTPPTNEQNRLLQALSMRGEYLDSVELMRIVPTFFSNFQAMKVLQAIAKQSGNDIAFPVQLDCMTLMDNIDAAGDYLMGVCDNIPYGTKSRDARYHAFFTTDPNNTGFIQDPIYRNYVAMFDPIPQMNEVKVKKERLTASEETRINWYFRDVATPDNTDNVTNIGELRKVQEIMSAHGNDIDLFKLSKYAPYVQAVEEANTTTTMTD